MVKTDFAADAGYEECLVTFFDILGFRALLNSRSASEIRGAMALFRNLSKGDDIEPARRMKDVRVQSQVHAEIISDAIVRTRTTQTQYHEGVFFWELLELLHIQIECIDKGILLRGAMTIGYMHVGLNLEGPVFGPGLVEAYEMEDREVVYPRIAIHEKLIERHRKDSALWQEDHSFADEKEYLDKLLRRDEAGLYFIDYLSASLEQMDAGFAGWCHFMERHRAIVQSGLADQENFSIRRKYAWLRNYHNTVVKEMKKSYSPNAISVDHDLPIREVIEELAIAD